MEVHHHSHIADADQHKRKKWTHYFWEFLMLFLAVFCGIWAEYQLEHTIEKERAKQLAFSLYNDIKKDTSELNTITRNFVLKKLGHIDSLVDILKNRIPRNDTVFSVHTAWAVFINNFTRNNGTYEQLKNSGSLRYFKQDFIIKLHEYENIWGRIRLREESEREKIEQRTIPYIQDIINYEFVHAILNNQPFPNRVYVKLEGPNASDQMINKIIEIKTLVMRRRILYEQLKEKAIEILSLLKEKYRLE